jgi:hypothetical protein
MAMLEEPTEEDWEEFEVIPQNIKKVPLLSLLKKFEKKRMRLIEKKERLEQVKGSMIGAVTSFISFAMEQPDLMEEIRGAEALIDIISIYEEYEKIDRSFHKILFKKC